MESLPQPCNASQHLVAVLRGDDPLRELAFWRGDRCRVIPQLRCNVPLDVVEVLRVARPEDVSNARSLEP
jgi:hypothetical protein